MANRWTTRRCRVACCAIFRRSGSTTRKNQFKQGLCGTVGESRRRMATTACDRDKLNPCFRKIRAQARFMRSTTRCPTHHYREAFKVLQKDGFFRKRDEKRDDSFFRPATPVTTPAPTANVTAEPAAEAKDTRREAKLVV